VASRIHWPPPPHHYPTGKENIVWNDAFAPEDGAIGLYLRRSRLSRNQSQEELAASAGVSARHMSFIETGRSRPSREVTMRLGEALELSANERNTLLRLAGFAPAFAPADLAPANRTLAADAITRLLDAQNPIPAVASDSLGYLLAFNEAATRLFGAARARPLGQGDNLFEMFFTDAGIRAAIVNWQEVAPALLHHLEQEALTAAHRAEAACLVARIRHAIGPAIQAVGTDLPMFRFDISSAGRHLRFVSNYSTFGVPHDATMQSIRIECFFPADPATQAYLSAVA
jgi:transcriptional regulator with XRE-family HTH domain